MNEDIAPNKCNSLYYGRLMRSDTLKKHRQWESHISECCTSQVIASFLLYCAQLIRYTYKYSIFIITSFLKFELLMRQYLMITLHFCKISTNCSITECVKFSLIKRILHFENIQIFTFFGFSIDS